EIENRQQEDPDDVDEVPVETGDLDRVVVRGREAAAPCEKADHRHHADPDRQVEGVDAGHREVEPEEEADAVTLGALIGEAEPRDETLVPVRPPLVALEREEDGPEEHRNGEQSEEEAPRTETRGANRERDGE